MLRLQMPRPVPVFEGALVTLRPPDPVGDAQDYFLMNQDPAMHTWTGNRVFDSIAEAQGELEDFIANPEISTWVIVDCSSGRVVGRFFLCLEDRAGVRVVGEGNRVARSCWRQGHNREARRLLFPYAFGDLRADLIETGAWAGNTNSLRSIEAHGFRFDREESRWNDKHQQQMTLRFYTMSRTQWQDLSGRSA